MGIIYIHEPTDLQCGQAVLAMLTGKTAEKVCEELGNARETKLCEMKKYLCENGFFVSQSRAEAFLREDLPKTALLSLETPRCWHWSLFSEGKFFDPEHGVMDDFPLCARKFFWEITRN